MISYEEYNHFALGTVFALKNKVGWTELGRWVASEEHLQGRSIRKGAFMKLIEPDTIIRLKPKEICPHKNACCFSNKPDVCYGTKDRNSEFVCNLNELKSLYKVK